MQDILNMNISALKEKGEWPSLLTNIYTNATKNVLAVDIYY